MVSESLLVMPNSLRLHGLYNPWNSLGQNTGVGSLSLLQGIFPTQGSNPGLTHCGQILYQLSHKESPRILEWVADPFSSRSSQPRNWTGLSCIAGGFFTNWAIREALVSVVKIIPNHFLELFCRMKALLDTQPLNQLEPKERWCCPLRTISDFNQQSLDSVDLCPIPMLNSPLLKPLHELHVPLT